MKILYSILLLATLNISRAWADMGGFGGAFGAHTMGDSITISASDEPTVNDSGDSGQYGELTYSLRGSVDLYKSFENEKLFRLSLAPQVTRQDLLGIGPTDRDAYVNTYGLTLGAMYKPEGREFYFAGLGFGFSGEHVFDGTQMIVPSLFAIGTYHFTPDTFLIYGAAFSTSLGVYFPLPVIGLFSQLSEEWSFFTFSLVVNQFTWKPKSLEDWTFSGFLKGSGFETAVSNNTAFPGSNSTIILRARSVEVGLGAEYRLSSWAFLQAQAGLLAFRAIKYTNSMAFNAADIYEQKMNDAPTAALSFTAMLSK